MKVPTLGSRQSMGISSEGSFIGMGHSDFFFADLPKRHAMFVPDSKQEKHQH